MKHVATRAVRLGLVGGVLLCATLSSGCATMSNADKGTLAGGALGTAAGAAIGSTRGNAGVGAVAGGVLGAVAGAITGSAIDENQRRTEAAIAAANAPPPLSLEEVANLSRNGSSDEVIVAQIQNSGSVYNLTADQIIWLQNNGVRDGVIRAMQQTGRYPRRRVYVAVPYPPPPVYVVPPPPPPVGVGIIIRGR